ncbi:NaeI family type II restriction endonuclease [Saccharopolyspora sp. TS4A08]|uniref:NaeI family type II restriction endonuclease n=1 Tax=Saccharopolyspora ipomoeae TaxID=3042027 RepID=A0ABT6PUN8_9PSEU|nr:NaeI family type II restriction endonuclease [Saccharopolyspora sp. TS4A08]MDI2031582.1 NaeI family type II restriction endonuclease [Saccharopolyspora sp. TS4A08]
MSTVRPSRFGISTNGGEVPPDLRPIVEWFDQQQDARERFRWTLRDSLDELLDGQRTGRWCYQHLSKAEKTHLGTAIEVNLTKEFEFDSGVDLDWRISGQDLDCKFSREFGAWEIPMEMYLCSAHRDRSGGADHPAMLVWLNEESRQWAAGLLRVTDGRLRWKRHDGTGDPERAYNRDNKRKINSDHFGDIFWLWGGIHFDLPENVLLKMDARRRARILTSSSGQERVNQLFREVTGKIVGRHTVLTVAQQDDSPKRARDARIALRSEGIVVLGHLPAHVNIARILGLPVPAKGEWVSERLAAVAADDDRTKVKIDGSWWAIARPGEAIAAGPQIPKDKLPDQDRD